MTVDPTKQKPDKINVSCMSMPNDYITHISMFNCNSNKNNKKILCHCLFSVSLQWQTKIIYRKVIVFIDNGKILLFKSETKIYLQRYLDRPYICHGKSLPWKIHFI